ncbi:hypothetical protein NPIL_150131 [Nephila pilipes]|uniref:Uncharacterized protein n=1 Tax=Nephila pilipes TaxID=299642 RepID=A0A8X6PQZ8_NEPPI|nr:hypothetical protein NPIL_150131 [Nephila pilipes]
MILCHLGSSSRLECAAGFVLRRSRPTIQSTRRKRLVLTISLVVKYFISGLCRIESEIEQELSVNTLLKSHKKRVHSCKKHQDNK